MPGAAPAGILVHGGGKGAAEKNHGKIRESRELEAEEGVVAGWPCSAADKVVA